MRKLIIGLAAFMAACGAELGDVQSANAGEAVQVAEPSEIPEPSAPLQITQAVEAEPARNLLTLA